MSAQLATTTVSILRGSVDDAYGDPTDTTTVVLSKLPASILEVGRGNTRRADQKPRTVRRYVCRILVPAAVVDDDRVKDERTGLVYTVNQVDVPGYPVGTANPVLQLSRAT